MTFDQKLSQYLLNHSAMLKEVRKASSLEDLRETLLDSESLN